jgi:hypothetical protein
MPVNLLFFFQIASSLAVCISFFILGNVIGFPTIALPVLTREQVASSNNDTSLLSQTRVSVQGVKSLGGHFACLCRGFELYEVKKKECYYFSKRKWKYFYTFNHFYSEKPSKRAK